MGLDQLGILFTGVAMHLLSKGNKWGFIVGVLVQPFWFWTAIINDQMGLFILNLYCSYSWCNGVYNFWIKGKKMS